MKFHGVTSEWKKFVPADYLSMYYSNITSENFGMLEFFAEASGKISQSIPEKSILLDFGSGPTIYSLITLSKHVQKIHICDWLESNLYELRKWLHNDPAAFDWSDFVRTALQCETKRYSKNEFSYPEEILRRETVIRKRISRIFRYNAYVYPHNPFCYDVLISTCCAESITDNKATWRKLLGNICSLLKPGGFLLLSSLEGANNYIVGKGTFSAVYLNSDDIIEELSANGFESQQVNIIPASEPLYGYKGIVAILAQRKE